MRVVWWIMVAFLAGCGSDVSIGPGEPTEDPDHDVGVTAGSRLRPVMAVADGVAAFMTWRDTELGVDCRFRPTADLVNRCLPTTPTVRFLDAACTEPVIVQNSCFDEAEYGGLLTQPDLEPCDRDQQQAYPLMYRRIPGALPHSVVHNGRVTPDGLECDPMPYPIEAHQVLERAEEVPLDTFVVAEKVVVPGAGRLGRSEWEAEDGARQVRTAFDQALDETCLTFPWFADDKLRCTPRHSTSRIDGVFADPSCAEPVAYASCDAPVISSTTLISPAVGCEVSLFEVGEPTSTVYGDGSEATCAPEMQADAIRFGPELFASDFPRLVEEQWGEGRLVVRYAADETGFRVQPNEHGFYDTEIERYCAPFGGHCVPPTAFDHDGLYADAACEVPVLVLSALHCGGPKWGRMRTGDACGGESTWLRVERALDTGTTVYSQSDDGSCSPSPIDDGEIAYELGPPRTVDSFAPVEVEVWWPAPDAGATPWSDSLS